ncbi:MAG: hypothetical protein M3Y66_06575 [Actinomycetota bacterium]|nr:hypothetical protein [Actinomycetota bacterium]
MTIIKAPLSSRAGLAAVLLVALMSLTACGGSGSGSASGSTSSTPTATSSAGTSSSAGAANTASPVPVETRPPGDIPDGLAFVTYTNQPGHYSFTHPEGWARTGSGVQVRFTDKLNGVAVTSLASSSGPSVATARSQDVARLKASVPAFQLEGISAVTLPGGKAVHIVFRRNSDPVSVTGKVYRDQVEEYLLFGKGHLVRMDLFGPVGADNVDAYRTMAHSLRVR